MNQSTLSLEIHPEPPFNTPTEVETPIIQTTRCDRRYLTPERAAELRLQRDLDRALDAIYPPVLR